ncbi:hypothetical protein KGP36_08360 [Patescibacteria group bacterium]|nr:hypothetical protein [Patescibacteria group bacterium]
MPQLFGLLNHANFDAPIFRAKENIIRVPLLNQLSDRESVEEVVMPVLE